MNYLVIALALSAPPPDAPSFEKDVRPIFKAYCLDCHGGGDKVQAKLDLRLKRFLDAGGDTGPAIVGREPGKSLLVQRLKSGEMPPGEKKVPAAQIAVIEKWIAAGAPTLRAEPEKLPPGIDITPEERAFWFFQPLRRPANTSLDALAGTPLGAAEADRRTLVRRVAFDLTGLPPTPDEVAAFLADASTDAYEKMLDRYLASPHYGERWARHWLDVAGYADSEGDNPNDQPRRYAYKYRDYVVRALNADKPLDRFVVEQLAGDELVPQPWNNLTPDQIETIAATGFLRTAPDPTVDGGDIPLLANQHVADTIKIVSSSLLGLSVGCAQCHDHRYDPIPQVDYFRMRAVFEPVLDVANWRNNRARVVSLYTDADRANAAKVEAEAAKLQEVYNVKQSKFMDAALEKELAKFAEPLRGQLREAYRAAADKRTSEQKKLLELNPSVNLNPGVLYQYNQAAADELKKDADAIAAKRGEKPTEDFVSLANESGAVPQTFLHYRGDYRQPKQPVTPGDLTIAAPDGSRFEIAPKDPKLATTGRRLAYSKHLTSGTHPLFNRVMANRIWLHHFGRGIVDTPGEFGVLGVRPTQPELLDYLATELPARGWSLKAMHRLVMTSRTYRQAVRPMQRLEAEAVRDAILAVAGTLDVKPFGPAVPVVEDFVGSAIPQNDSTRRSVYLQVRRTKPVSLLATFDAAGTAVNCDKRVSSTSGPQALVLMNSEFVIKNSDAFAKRVRGDAPTLAGQVTRAWDLAFQRPITPEESAAALKFLERQEAAHRAAGRPNPDFMALANLCHQLICSNEFLYVG